MYFDFAKLPANRMILMCWFWLFFFQIFSSKNCLHVKHWCGLYTAKYSKCSIRMIKYAKYEPPHDKTNKMACAPSEDSDQPGHPPSLIRVLAVRMKKAWVLSYPLSAQRRSDWVDAQADVSLCWAQSHFVGFVKRRLKWFYWAFKFPLSMSRNLGIIIWASSWDYGTFGPP